MKVLTAPLTFITGDVLAPADLNGLYLYGQDAVADVSEKRWAKAVLTFPFVTDVGSAYTGSSGELLSYRFTSPVTCIVERGFLSANMTSSAAVLVDITKVSGGTTPDGCTVPWLSTADAVASAATDTLDINVDRVLLVAGSEYKITVSSTAAFTLNRFDVSLHVAVDRWTVAGTTAIPAFDPTLFTDASAVNAGTVATNNSSMATEAAKFALALTAPTPTLFVKHGFIIGTDTDLLTFSLPRFAGTRAQAKVTRIYVYAVMASAPGASSFVRAYLRDQSGSVLETVTADVSGVTEASGDSGAISRAIDGGVSATTASDYSVLLENLAAVNCLRFHVLVWIARA